MCNTCLTCGTPGQGYNQAILSVPTSEYDKVRDYMSHPDIVRSNVAKHFKSYYWGTAAVVDDQMMVATRFGVKWHLTSNDISKLGKWAERGFNHE